MSQGTYKCIQSACPVQSCWVTQAQELYSSYFKTALYLKGRNMMEFFSRFLYLNSLTHTDGLFALLLLLLLQPWFNFSPVSYTSNLLKESREIHFLKHIQFWVHNLYVMVYHYHRRLLSPILKAFYSLSYFLPFSLPFICGKYRLEY